MTSAMTDEQVSAAASPPTWRVIAVMELLANLDHGLKVAEMAKRLSVPRATIAAIARELAAANWLERDDHLRYRIGGSAFALVHQRYESVSGADGSVVAQLARDTGCGVTLSRIADGKLTVALKKYPETGRVIPGFALGQQIPLRYPAGAAVMPWRDRDEQQRWLATSSVGVNHGRELIRAVADSGFVMFGPSDGSENLVDVLVELLSASGSVNLERSVRDSALRQIARLTSRSYTTAEILAPGPLPVSYVSAPIVRDGRADHELQIGLLATTVDATCRQRVVELLGAAVQELSDAV